MVEIYGQFQTGICNEGCQYHLLYFQLYFLTVFLSSFKLGFTLKDANIISAGRARRHWNWCQWGICIRYTWESRRASKSSELLTIIFFLRQNYVLFTKPWQDKAVFRCLGSQRAPLHLLQCIHTTSANLFCHSLWLSVYCAQSIFKRFATICLFSHSKQSPLLGIQLKDRNS